MTKLKNIVGGGGVLKYFKSIFLKLLTELFLIWNWPQNSNK